MVRKRATQNTKDDDAVLTISLVCRQDRTYSTGILRGIGRYACGYNNLALVLVLPDSQLSEALGAIKPAGIIANADSQAVRHILRRARRPVVNTCLDFIDPHFGHVTVDDASIGVLAAKHLLDCGLKNFGYFGLPWNSDIDSSREDGFCQTLRNLSHKVSVCYNNSRPWWSLEGGDFASSRQVGRWLRGLPKPCGVFATYDSIALQLCGACRREGIKVPEGIAIISVDNDELTCELSHPTISSIEPPAERIGYEAAAMLDRMMRHESVPDKPLFLPATRIITRQSTNILAGVDHCISDAVCFIREHISDPITVDDVVRQARLPRRSFERKFREAIGRSPAQEIRHVRIEMAKTLWAANPQMKTESVVRHCGFFSRTQFTKAFRLATGVTPADYRRTMLQESGRKVSSAKVLADFPADSSSKIHS
jgi:LacI family transcriptional regulator